MDYVHLGVLPRSRKWRQVIEQLRLEADAETPAAATADGTDVSLKRESIDRAVLHRFWLLTQIHLDERNPTSPMNVRRHHEVKSTEPLLRLHPLAEI
jgi:hypothetical protein